MSCDVGEVTERLENEQSYIASFPLIKFIHDNCNAVCNISDEVLLCS